jgi:hypothetical protein
MVRNRVFLELPVFFGYTLFHLVRALLLLCIKYGGSANAYAYSYWIAEGISAVLGLLVIHEVFIKLVGRFKGIVYISTALFRWTFAILIVLAFVAAISAPPEKTPGLIAAVLSLERSVRMIQCGLLLFLFVFASALSISWRQSVFGIALGFGFYSSVELIIVSTRIQTGTALADAFVLMKPAAYVVAMLVWTVYLLLPAPAYALPEHREKNLVSDWNAAILGMLRQ